MNKNTNKIPDKKKTPEDLINDRYDQELRSLEELRARSKCIIPGKQQEYYENIFNLIDREKYIWIYNKRKINYAFLNVFKEKREQDRIKYFTYLMDRAWNNPQSDYLMFNISELKNTRNYYDEHRRYTETYRSNREEQEIREKYNQNECIYEYAEITKNILILQNEKILFIEMKGDTQKLLDNYICKDVRKIVDDYINW